MKKILLWSCVPIAGAAVYLLFFTPNKIIDYQIPTSVGIHDPQFARAMGSLLGPSLIPGNRVTTLLNGDQIFPAMLEAVQKAEKSINFETYIYWSGSVGKQFADALSERAKKGVAVNLLVDWVGSLPMDEKHMDLMKKAGVDIKYYRPLHWYNFSRWNNRTHRKLLIVDGKIGFTGGVGIADKWLGNADSPEHWRESHFQLEGPGVAQMQATFLDNWIKTGLEVLTGENYFPALDEMGSNYVQNFRSSPSEGSQSVRLMYLLSIAASRESILLSSAYFVPDNLAIKILVEARRRGVEVKIIVPGPHTDTKITGKASKALWGKLLEAGCEIYEYQPTMYHVKVFIVDNAWVSVGSTNFDDRSFRLNDEANMNILDEPFARAQVAIFEEDRKKSRKVSLQEWQNRPWKEKAEEYVASLFRSQL